MKSTTTLHILAVNYFGSSHVARLLDTLESQDNDGWHITIIDNSQSPVELSALEALAEDLSRVDLLVPPSNLGYYGAAEWWRNHHFTQADWYAVSNTDIELEPDFCSVLAGLGHDLTIVAPSITASPSGRPQNPYMLGRPSTARMFLRWVALSTRVTAIAAGVIARRRSVRTTLSANHHQTALRLMYAPHGSFILFHSSYLDRGGSWFHPVFLFNEELTIAERAASLEMVTTFVPQLRVAHQEHQATGTVRSRVVFQAQRKAALYGLRLIACRRGTLPPAARNGMEASP